MAIFVCSVALVWIGWMLGYGVTHIIPALDNLMNSDEVDAMLEELNAE
jgi:hypothetical protein